MEWSACALHSEHFHGEAKDEAAHGLLVKLLAKAKRNTSMSYQACSQRASKEASVTTLHHCEAVEELNRQAAKLSSLLRLGDFK